MPKPRRRPVRRVFALPQVLRAEAVPQVQAGPDGLLFVLLPLVQVGVGEEDGDLLLAAAVEESEAPGGGLVVGVEAAVELGAGGAAQAGHLGWRGRVLADAQVQVPLLEIDREIAVEEARAGRAAA